MWDKENNYLRLHRRLTPDHFQLNSTLKMRNHLAVQVLNSDMLYLLQNYQASMTNPSDIAATVELVRITSDLIKAYYSSEPITNTQDERLTILASIAAYFHEWHDYCKKEGLTLKQNFITIHSYQDIITCIDGFIYLCRQRCATHPIIPRIINSDVCENIFCQARTSYNGPNTHPDASQYR